MPNGIVPQSQDDKDWKIAAEKELVALRKIIATLQIQVNAQSQR